MEGNFCAVLSMETTDLEGVIWNGKPWFLKDTAGDAGLEADKVLTCTATAFETPNLFNRSNRSFILPLRTLPRPPNFEFQISGNTTHDSLRNMRNFT